MGSNTFSQKGVQGARGDRKRERAKCDGRKGKDAARGGSYDDKPAPEFWDHYFREENFQGVSCWNRAGVAADRAPACCVLFS